MKHKNFNLSVIASVVLLTACGSSGSGDPVAEPTATPSATATPSPSETPTPPSSGTPTPAPMPTPNPTPSPQPTPPAPTPTPTACISAPTPTTGYSLVFKGCSATNVAEYYDKTECVRDNATGLIWEGKPTSGFRTFQYFNFDNFTVRQKWVAPNGPAIFPTSTEVDDENNSVGFRNNVNAIGLCGFTNWRIPARFELEGLIKPNQNPKIDNLWLPNTGTSGFYWTSTADLETYNGTGVNFFDGTTSTGFRTLLNYVRLVRQ